MIDLFFVTLKHSLPVKDLTEKKKYLACLNSVNV